jgi:hypothetical protein
MDKWLRLDFPTEVDRRSAVREDFMLACPIIGTTASIVVDPCQSDRPQDTGFRARTGKRNEAGARGRSATSTSELIRGNSNDTEVSDRFARRLSRAGLQVFAR